MIYFDRAALKVLSRINRSGDKGITWARLQDRFGRDDAHFLFLESLSREEYTITQDQHGKWIENWDATIHRTGQYKSYSTPKGRELLEIRSFNFWKWSIPTAISVLALALSVITFWVSVGGNEIIRVLLVN